MLAAFRVAHLTICSFDLYHNSRNGAFEKDVNRFLVQINCANEQISNPKSGQHFPELLHARRDTAGLSQPKIN
jgi:hypothetical protein